MKHEGKKRQTTRPKIKRNVNEFFLFLFTTIWHELANIEMT